MEQETRDIFFSLGGSIGGARVNDNRVAGRGQQGTEASRDNACAAAGSGQQNKTEIAAHGRNTDQPLFSAYFGTKQAWTSVQEPAIRTQGRHDKENRVLHCLKFTSFLNHTELIVTATGAPCVGACLSSCYVEHSAVPQRSLAERQKVKAPHNIGSIPFASTLVSGPYLGKNWGARRETSESKRHLSNPTRWAVIGAKVSHKWQRTEYV